MKRVLKNWWWMWVDAVIVLSCGSAVLAALFGVIAGLSYINEVSKCRNYAALSGLSTYTSLSTGCLVRRGDGKWVSADSYASNDAEVKVTK